MPGHDIVGLHRPPAAASAGASGDGFISQLDLTVLAMDWPGGRLDVSAVPEPAVLSPLVLGGLALLRRKKQQAGGGRRRL